MSARQNELFQKPARRMRGVLMEICDASHDAIATVQFECLRCGHRTGWIEFSTVTEAKRRLPCPKCNGQPFALRIG